MLWNHIEKFDTVIWDWNGTLLNDHEAAWRAERKLFDRLGKAHLDVLERKKLFTMPVQEYYTRIGFDFEKMSYDEASEIWFAHYLEELATTDLFPGTRELLAKVIDSGKKQFILSAAPESYLDNYTEAKDLKKFFHGIYGLKTKVADCKRERGRDLFREHELRPKSALIIGDMVHDAEVAEDLGCHVLLVADGHQAYELLSETPLCGEQRTVLKSRFVDDLKNKS